MNSEKAISIFGLAMGIGLFIFGIIGASGALSFIEPKRTWLIFFFAILLIIWHWLSFKSLKKAEQNKNTVEAISGGQPSEASAGSTGQPSPETPEAVTPEDTFPADAKAGESPAEAGEADSPARED